MNHIFVSYSRRDADLVDRMVDGLRSQGYPIWQDTSGKTSGIPYSTKWFKAIEDAIFSSSCALIFDSESWRASAPCRKEYELFRKDVIRILGALGIMVVNGSQGMTVKIEERTGNERIR